MLRSSRCPSFHLIGLLFGTLLLGNAASRPAAGDVPAQDGPGLGWLLDAADVADLPSTSTIAADRPPIARLEARWDRIERISGAYDWTELVTAIDALHGEGYRTVLALTGSNALYLPDGAPPSPLVEGSTEAWLAFVRSAVRSLGDRVAVFEIGETRQSRHGLEADVQALLIKQSALAVRAEADGTDVLVAQGALNFDDLAWQRQLWDRDIAAYIDILPVWMSADDPADLASRVRLVYEESLRHPPAPVLWTYIPDGAGWDGAAAAVEALTAGATAALFVPAAVDAAEQVRWTVGLQRTLATGFAPASTGSVRVDYVGGAKPPGARVLGRFFNENDFSTMIVFQAPASGPGEPELIVDAGTVRDARLLDPLTGDSRRVRTAARDGARAVRVGAAEFPRAFRFRRPAVTPGFELPAEELEVASARGLTAEEIIARFQQVQRDQDDRLERWMARGRIDFHFKLGEGSATVDVSVDSNYFWERGGQLEWEQTDYYINGNKVRWKSFPELPLIQPEKIITLPLDLTLDKTYNYRLAGEARIGDRDVYVLEFRPAVESSRSLYSGRLWIDKSSFARLRASLIQDNLEAPVLSNEEIDRFSERFGPDGRTYWMFDNIDGQQVWNTGGRTFVVRREVTFREYEINPPRQEFEGRRRQAYASKNQMLRDTDEGFRYLERQDDGSRIVKQEMDTSQLFAAAGAFKDNAQENIVPLAGVNYFDYDIRGSRVQLNALFAGVLAFVTASKPDLFGRKIDLTADAGLSALKSDDKVFEGDVERVEERLEDRNQTLALRLGLPAGPFFKFTLVGSMAYRQFFHDDDAIRRIDDFNMESPPDGAQLEFVLPQDHVELSGRFEAEFNRRGYTLSGTLSHSRRSDWEPWGLRDTVSGEFGELDDEVFVPSGAEPVEDTFTRWGLTAFKEWYLPGFHKVRGTVNYLDGSALDRFSRYQFSFFGQDRLNGFSGSGVRFDEGVILRAGYAFNLFEVIRLNSAVETAWVEQDGSSAGRQSFTGIGLSGNVVGPWKTVINLNYGYALASDIPDLEGEQEFLLLVLKLF